MTKLERLLSVFTKLRSGEGRSLTLFMLNSFLILLCYYILKPLRESLILTEFSAEVRSYAVATIAVLLLFIVPLYGVLFRGTSRERLVQSISLFFIVNMVIFYLMGVGGMQLGFVYFVWLGIFGVMVPAQFWAFAADSYNVKSGQRLFPVIMAGASLGALVGAQLSKHLFPYLGPFNLMLVAGAILLTTLWLGPAARRAVPVESRVLPGPQQEFALEKFLSGFAVVLRDRYLLLIALVVVLLNWVNSTGEFILAELVVRQADIETAAGGTSLDKGDFIAAFYGDFIFAFTLLGLLLQVFLVSRIYRWIGVSGALLILPLIAMIGYGLIVFVPIFSIIRIVKILENSTDYSIMNTTRQALFLPTGDAEKYEGKTAIDTFFWRFGDLIQAGFIYAGLNFLDFEMRHFALLNLVLAGLWLILSMEIGRHYNRRIGSTDFNVAPELAQPLPDLHVDSGGPIHHTIAEDSFTDADPGDLLTLSARLAGGHPLPGWLEFDPRRRTFRGKAPHEVVEELRIEVVATDVDGLSATGTFVLRQSQDRGRET